MGYAGGTNMSSVTSQLGSRQPEQREEEENEESSSDVCLNSLLFLLLLLLLPKWHIVSG